MARFALSLLLLSLFFGGCTSPQLREGMTQAEVAQKLGSPLRTQRLSGGRETWFYESVHKTRTRHTADNSSRPGESVYERDLRIDTERMVKSVEYVTTEIRETTPITFDRDGRLQLPPARRFVPTGS